MGSHTLRVNSETYAKIQAMSFVRGLSMSDVVARAMTYYIESSPVKDAVHDAITAKRSVIPDQGDANERI